MENDFKVNTKFEVVFGRKYENKLLHTKDAGHALNAEGASYYAIYLWHTGKTYYLSPNRSCETQYTIYEKKVEDSGSIHFRNPVGRAWVPHDLTTHLEIDFNAMNRRLYMSLFPSL